MVASKAVHAAQSADGRRVELDENGTIMAQALVLANGNQPPEPLGIASGLGKRFINNPWNDEAKAAVREAAAGDRIWALGPLTKGRYWEIVAVPDIRGQAAQVAEDIARELEQ